MSGTGRVTYGGEETEAVTVGSWTLEMHWEPPMTAGRIRGYVDDLKTFESRILGRAHDQEGEFDDAATEFTDIIKWDISTISSSDLADWMNVCSSITFAAGITEEWADDVKEYKLERLRIIRRWNSEAPALGEDLDKDPVFWMNGFSDMGFQKPSERAAADLAALKEELEGEEDTAYWNLRSRSYELSNDLRNGPTPEAVQRLIENGYTNWSYFNLGGDVESIPIDDDPDELAEKVAEFAEDPENYEGDITEITALLNNIGIVAADKQENGGTLTREELAFLTNFYDALEEAGGAEGDPPGVLNVTEQISGNTSIDHETAERLLGGLGNGILVLSDESLLGSYERLPDSIRNVVGGPREGTDYDRLDWWPHTTPLADLLEHTNPQLSGGEQFSVNLTQTVASELDVWNLDPDDEDDYRANPLFFNGEPERLIEVSSRNDEANYAILTGEGNYQHPVHGLDAEMTFRALYTYDWDDGGAAAAGMTDWMAEPAEGYQEERIGEAMASFMDLFSDPAFNNALSGTGHPVSGEIIDENGRTVEMEWEDASAGHLNPELAWSWSDLFSAHIDSFASTYGTPLGSGGSIESGNYWGNPEGLMLEPGSREKFIQQIMGDANAASRVYAEAIQFGHESLEEFPINPTENGSLSTDGASQSGILRGMVDTALNEESIRREDNHSAAADYQNLVTGYGIDMFAASLSEIPVPGSSMTAEALKIFTKEEFNIESFAAEPRVENNNGEWEINESARLRMIRFAAEEDPELMSTIKENIPGIVQQDADGNDYIPESHRNWDVLPGDHESAMSEAWQFVNAEGSATESITAGEAVEYYEEAYNNARGKINED